MEARVNGIVRSGDCGQVKEVFTALAGTRPWPIEIHEIGLDHTDNPEVILHRFRVESCSIYDQGTRWTASQYSKPPWGDKVLASLNATIRLSKDVSAKVSPMTMENWKNIGYRTRYHIVKESVAWDIRSPGGRCLHVIMYDMYKGIEKGEILEKGERYSESSSVVEIWTKIEDGHERSLLALTWLGDLLSRYNVSLAPLTDRKKAIHLSREI